MITIGMRNILTSLFTRKRPVAPPLSTTAIPGCNQFVKCARDERGWLIPRVGTVAREIYDLLIVGKTPVEVCAAFPNHDPKNIYARIWRIKNPNLDNMRRNAQNAARKARPPRRRPKRRTRVLPPSPLTPSFCLLMPSPLIALPPPRRRGRSNACSTPDVIYLSGPVRSLPLLPRKAPFGIMDIIVERGEAKFVGHFPTKREANEEANKVPRRAELCVRYVFTNDRLGVSIASQAIDSDTWSRSRIIAERALAGAI